jgi:3-hydroxyacyl-[acyl-carrier-protein] dehydratase
MKLKNQLFKINDFTPTDDGMVCHVSLLPDCIIYKAHFPKRPITPGVCIVQMAKELIETYLERAYEISEIKNVKFLYILSPIESPEVIFTFSKVDVDTTGNTVSAKVDVADDNHLFTTISFTCETKQ